jgi:hypothetical protein
MMLVLHDDAKREYAYGPALGMAATKVGTFTQQLYDEAKEIRRPIHPPLTRRDMGRRV